MRPTRLILVMVLLVFSSPLPWCAIIFVANGENCHTGRVGALLEGSPSLADSITPSEQQRHDDSICACDLERPTRSSEQIALPMSFGSTMQRPLLLPQIVPMRRSFASFTCVPMATVSLPLLI